MIRLNCFFEVLPGHADEVLKLAKELVAASLNDKGCKGYDLFVSATRPDVMMFCETYADLVKEMTGAMAASRAFYANVPFVFEDIITMDDRPMHEFLLEIIQNSAV